MTHASAIVKPNFLLNGLMGIGLLIATELMLFTGFISSFLVARANAGTWPPLGLPELPVFATAINTTVLVLSGICLWRANRSNERTVRIKWLHASFVLGAVFVLVQGGEWLRLIRFGLTTTSSLYGSYFYLIVGAHALHVLVGLGILALLTFKISKDQARFHWLQVFSWYWYFVVALWPVLYGLVYFD